MDTLYRTLEKGGIGIIESPTGTVCRRNKQIIFSREKRLVYCVVPLHGYIQPHRFPKILSIEITYPLPLPRLRVQVQ